jgi:hypothetical protein
MKYKILLFTASFFFSPAFVFASTPVSGTLSADTTWTEAESPYLVPSPGFIVPLGVNLTLEPGTVVKFAQYASLTIIGTLQVNGIAESPVYFTSLTDDSVGGDTNGDGSATSAGSTKWRTINVQQTAIANFTYAVLRYGGSTNTIAISNSGTLTVSHSEITHGNYGILHGAGTSTITDTVFDDNIQYGFFTPSFTTGVVSLFRNTFSRNLAPGYFNLDRGAVINNSNNIAIENKRNGFFVQMASTTAASQTWTADGIPYVVSVKGVTVPRGKSLTVEQGTIIKFEQNNASLVVNGALDVRGTADNPVYFTSFSDDTLGGDSDGTDNPPYYYQNWGAITLQSGASANFTHAVLKRGGVLSNSGGVLAVSNSEIFGSINYGIFHSEGTTTVSQTSIHGNAGYGVYNGTTGILNAENNWWGGTNGPYHPLLNVAGIGNNRVSDYVAFTPWLGSDPLATSSLALTDPVETEDDGNQDAKGVADKTVFTFGVTVDGAPDSVNLIVGSNTGTTTIPLPQRLGLWEATSTFAKGKYTWHIEATAGGQTVQTADRNFTTGYSNVAFLPGLEASRLYRAAIDPTYGTPTKVRLWEPPLVLQDNSQLYLNASGTPKRSDIFTEDVVDEVDQFAGANIYESFIDSMDDLVDDGTIRAWKPLPYDWRFDVRDIVNRPIALESGSYSMTEEIWKLAESSDTGKVTLIAHSNGGLVSKVLARELGTDAPKLLDQMILVASPQAGTPQAIGAILHGYNQGLPKDWLPLLMTSAEARDMAVNMPSAYGLLPFAGYFSSVGDPVITFDNDPLLAPWRAKYGIEIHSAETLHNFLADQTRASMPVTEETKNPIIANETLLNSAEVLHDTVLDTWTPPEGITLTQIAGWGEDTLSKIVYYQGIKTVCANPGLYSTCASTPALEYSMKEVLDGDGTVVVPSALWTSGEGRYWVDLGDYNRFIHGNISRKHADILEIPELREFIKSTIIRDNSAVLPRYIFSQTPPNPDSEKQLRFTLHSPLTLDLYDNLGNHTGISTTTGAREENIPGSRYRTFGELKYISVPAFAEASSGEPSSTTLTLAMNGYATGSFTLDMEEVVGDTVTASTTFAGIPSSVGTVATITIPDGNIANSSALSVDENGDGTADLTLVPKLGDVVTLPRPILTVTADDKTITLGSPIPPLSSTFSPTSTDVTGVPNCTTTATASSTVGAYPIICTLGTLASNTYDFAFATTGTLSILYRFDGFLQPINDTAYHTEQTASVFKGGSTVPVKFQIKKSDGTPIQANVLPTFSFQKGNIMSASVDESTYSDTATVGITFRWDGTSQQYIYNWSTKGITSGYWYKLSAKLDDGKTYSVVVGLR